jgi:hypothetical protein
MQIPSCIERTRTGKRLGSRKVYSVLAQKNPEGLHAKLIEEIADVCEPDHKTASCTASVELPNALLVRWTANVRRPVSPLVSFA